MQVDVDVNGAGRFGQSSGYFSGSDPTRAVRTWWAKRDGSGSAWKEIKGGELTRRMQYSNRYQLNKPPGGAFQLLIQIVTGKEIPKLAPFLS